jgi:LacI family transcriptional regulator
MRVTVSGIARSCGLSTATVDRVLNNRSGVSAANRQRVMQAAHSLGYLPMAGDVTLPAKPVRLEFFLPMDRNAFMAEIGSHLIDYAARLPLVAGCRVHNLPGISPASLQVAMDDLGLDARGVGVVAVDHPRTRNVLGEIADAGIRLVTIISDVPIPTRSAYVGLDNRMAGRTAALLMGRLSCGRSGKVAVLTGSRSYRCHEERETGFATVMTEDFPGLSVLDAIEVNEAPDVSHAATLHLLRSQPDLVGLYCVGGGRSGVARAIRETSGRRKPIFICHDLTRLTRSYLVDDVADVIIDQNARLIAEQSVIQLLGSIASVAPFLSRTHIEPRLIFRENIPA